LWRAVSPFNGGPPNCLSPPPRCPAVFLGPDFHKRGYPHKGFFTPPFGGPFKGAPLWPPPLWFGPSPESPVYLPPRELFSPPVAPNRISQRMPNCPFPGPRERKGHTNTQNECLPGVLDLIIRTLWGMG